MTTYYRVDPKKEDPERLLDPENQESEPWSGTVKGTCDKCGGEGETEFECESCKDHVDKSCEVCRGEIKYVGECPVCEGTGEIDDSKREGVSVFPDEEGLYRYMIKNEAELDGDCRLVALEGEQSEDEDFDADEGAVLIKPTKIVDVGELDWDKIERVKQELA